MTIGCLQDISATTAPLGISYHSGHYCGAKALLLGSSTDCFPHLAHWKATLDNMIPSPSDGGIHVRYKLDPDLLLQALHLKYVKWNGNYIKQYLGIQFPNKVK